MVRLLDGIQYATMPKETFGDIQEIAFYSEFHDGWADFESTKTLRHFVRPRVPQDLNIGYAGWVARHSQRPLETKPFGIKSLDYIIEACLESENADRLLDSQVITKRGILFKLSREKGGLCVNVCLIDGRLFIEEYDSRPDKSRLDPLMHIGHAFKEACTAGPRHGDWSTVVSRTIGNINVLFGAQVDCIKDEQADHRQPMNFVQLKTMKDNYRFKNSMSVEQRNWYVLGGWYMQAYLLGIPSIFVGYRNCKGESAHLFDPARSIGRVHRFIRALFEFTKAEQKKQSNVDEVKVWRATISVKGALDVVEVPPEELDLVERVGIVKRKLVERIRELERLTKIIAL